MKIRDKHAAETAVAGTQVAAARMLLSWSQTELAERSGVTRRTVYALESGGEISSAKKEAIIGVFEQNGITFLNAARALGVVADPLHRSGGLIGGPEDSPQDPTDPHAKR